jgi:TM2 domain-containing membrane protein YozV
MNNIYIHKDDQQHGPFTEAEVHDLLRQGQFTNSDLSWVEGYSEWKPLVEILSKKEISSPENKMPSTQSYVQSEASQSRMVVLILCLFFGWLGMHRFYVGKWLTGLIQMFTLGGLFLWWAIDFLLIIFGSFKNSAGFAIGRVAKPSTHTSQQRHQEPAPSGFQSNEPSDWIMRAKPTPYWKFILGMNLFKGYQLDFVEKKGDNIVVAVQSGKHCAFRTGEFSAKIYKTKEGLRDFKLKGTTSPQQKISFRETQMQMDEEWWDELASKIGATEAGLSKVLSFASKIIE